MKIGITGGDGFIGTNLVNELGKRKYKVFSIDLLNNNKDNYFRCDVSNFRQLEYVFVNFGPFDYVYHLSAEYG